MLHGFCIRRGSHKNKDYNPPSYKYLAIYFQVSAYEEPQMNADKRGCLSAADSSAFICVHSRSVKAVFPGKNPGKLLAGYLPLFFLLKSMWLCFVFTSPNPSDMRNFSMPGNFRIRRAKISDGKFMDIIISGQSCKVFQFLCGDVQEILQSLRGDVCVQS